MDDVLRNAASRSDIPDMSASWDGIASGLDIIQKRRRRRLVILFTALFLVGITSVVWLTTSEDTITSEEIKNLDTELAESPTTSNVERDVDIVGSVNSDPVTGGGDISISDETSAKEKSQDEGAFNKIDRNVQETVEDDVATAQEERGAADAHAEKSGTTKDDVIDHTVEDGSKAVAEVESEQEDVQPEYDTNTETEEDRIVEANPVEEESIDESDPKQSGLDPKIKKESGWEINVAASPGLAAKLIAESANFGWLVNQAYSDIANSETSSFSYQVDLGLNRKFNDRFYMGVGLRYVEREERVQYDYTIDKLVTIRESEQTLQYTELAPVLWREVNYDGLNRYQFIDIPVRLGILTPMNEKLTWRNEFSVNYSRLIAVSGKKVDNTFLELIDANSLKLNKNNIGVTGKTGIMWTASPRLDWTLDGLYNMNMNSLRAKEQGLLERPFNYGLTIGANYKILTK